MLTLKPVVERVRHDVWPFDLWPVAAESPGWLPLRATMTPADVGTAMWSMLFFSIAASDPASVPAEPALALRLLSDLDYLYLPGGLLLADQASGVSVEPGCCVSVDEWRDWALIAAGGIADLGHNPTPQVEHHDGTVRIWADDDLRDHLDVDRAALRELLRSAQHDLTGFLTAVRSWATAISPSDADGLTAALDARLQIGSPLFS